MRKTPFSLLAIAAAVAVVAAVTFFGTTPAGTTTAPLSAEGPSNFASEPGWAGIAFGIMLHAMLVGVIVLAFLPFRRSQRELPVFFRAHLFVPVLFELWFWTGNVFPFSPHQLTRILPGFLLGANDWGVGNIYTYTKLADWLALLAGCVACAHLASEGASMADGFAKRLRLCLPHMLAAAVLHLVPVVFISSFHSALAIDNGCLFVWLLAGFFVIALLQSLATEMRRQWPTVLSWLAAFGWLFVPVALSRP